MRAIKLRRLLPIALLLAGLAWCVPAQAAIAVGTCAGTFASASANSIALTISISAGGSVFVFVRQGTDRTTTWTVNDSAPNGLYTQTGSGYRDDGVNAARVGMHQFTNLTNSITSITATFGIAVVNRSIVACEMTGTATSSLEDTSVNSSSAVAATSLTSGTFTTTNANDLLVYCLSPNGVGGTFTAGTNYAKPTNGNDGTIRAQCQTRVVAATQSAQTTSMSWTTSEVGVNSIFAAFKALPASTFVPQIGGFLVGP